MAKVDLGDEYRLLVKGELIEKTDEYLNREGKWVPAFNPSVGGRFDPHYHFTYRRRVTPVTTSGPYVAIEVHRAALKEIDRLMLEKQHLCAHLDAKYEDEKRLKAELEAVKQPQPEPEWFDLTPFGEHVWRSCDEAFLPSRGQWLSVYMAKAVGASISEMRRVGYTQFRCLLKDAPPELLAKASKPAEDPDEWVAITDENHVARRGIDHIRAFGGGLEPVLGLTGMLLKDISTELFCRRRDLPPMPEKPKTETVRFHEVIVVSPETNNRYLCWVEHIDKRQGDIPTGETKTRELPK